MEPIISPWIFYTIDVVCNLNGTLEFLSAVSFFLIGYLAWRWLTIRERTWDEDRGKKIELYAKWVKRLCIFFIADVFIMTFLPSKETMITMLVSNYVTPDNIQAVQGNIVDFTKQLASAVTEGINQTGGK